jgi:hypothetical protein
MQTRSAFQRILPRPASRDRDEARQGVEQVRRVYRTRFMGGLNEPNFPDALRDLSRKQRASTALTRQETRAHLLAQHDLQSGLQ